MLDLDIKREWYSWQTRYTLAFVSIVFKYIAGYHGAITKCLSSKELVSEAIIGIGHPIRISII